jgi:hypothetical protein
MDKDPVKQDDSIKPSIAAFDTVFYAASNF